VAPCVEWSVVCVSVLGPLRVEAGQSDVPVGGRQLRLLLILLALEAGRVVPAAVLAARLWPEEEPADPGNALQTLVSRLRAALRPAGLDPPDRVALLRVPAGRGRRRRGRAGRQAQALTVFAEGRELLTDCLGVGPSPVREQPYLRILRGISERPVVPAPASLTPPVVTPPADQLRRQGRVTGGWRTGSRC